MGEILSNKDSLSRALYDMLFEWMVRRLNKSISPDHSNINSNYYIKDKQYQLLLFFIIISENF